MVSSSAEREALITALPHYWQLESPHLHNLMTFSHLLYLAEGTYSDVLLGYGIRPSRNSKGSMALRLLRFYW